MASLAVSTSGILILFICYDLDDFFFLHINFSTDVNVFLSDCVNMIMDKENVKKNYR